LTIPEADDKGKTTRIDLPSAANPLPGEPDPLIAAEPRVAAEPQFESESAATVQTRPAAQALVEPTAVVARPASPQEREVLFVPLAVNIGDGFKFGCGFFLALVLAMLIGFVLLAALFALTSVFGLNLPLGR
jgi:hypothetical protein